MCKRSQPDEHWCQTHHAEFSSEEQSCQAVLEGRVPAADVQSSYVQRAMDRGGRRSLEGGLVLVIAPRLRR